jgi:hypothetical protein
MTKFCGNCGTELDYGTDVCVRCDTLPTLKRDIEVLTTRLSLTSETLMACERQRKTAVNRWDKLRNWLSNLLTSETVNRTEKLGVKIVMDIMDRIEEGE